MRRARGGVRSARSPTCLPAATRQLWQPPTRRDRPCAARNVCGEAVGCGGLRTSFFGLPSWWFGRLGIARDPRRLPRLGWAGLWWLGKLDWARLFLDRRQYHPVPPGQRRISVIRALTSFLTRPIGIGFASGSRTVPLDTSYPFKAAASLRRIAPVIGNRLQWFLNAAYQTSSRPSNRNAGMR